MIIQKTQIRGRGAMWEVMDHFSGEVVHDLVCCPVKCLLHALYILNAVIIIGDGCSIYK
jgi:hypothetical protein